MKRCIQIEIDELNDNPLFEFIDEDLKKPGVIFNVITGVYDPIIQV